MSKREIVFIFQENSIKLFPALIGLSGINKDKLYILSLWSRLIYTSCDFENMEYGAASTSSLSIFF